MIGARDVGGETVNDPDSGQGGCAKFQWRFVCSAAGRGLESLRDPLIALWLLLSSLPAGFGQTCAARKTVSSCIIHTRWMCPLVWSPGFNPGTVDKNQGD